MAFLNGEDGKSIAYNPSLAISNLKAFKSTMESALMLLSSAYSEFIKGLSECWASPFAVNFYAKSYRFVSVIANGVNDSNALLNNAIAAVATMARRCGSTFSYRDSIVRPTIYETKILPSFGGSVVIDIPKVQNLLATFNNKISVAKSVLASVPPQIAIYDTTGAIRTLYNQRISALKTGIESSVAEINGTISSTIAEQEELIRVFRARALAKVSML